MPNGYHDKVLWVDLSSGKIKEESYGEELYRKFLGGYGLGAKLIWDRQKGSGIDALGEENILGFCPGLLTGTGALFAGRYMAVGKSPLTGTWGDANSGGFFSLEIKKCGYDGIFFTGRSEKPVYLLVADGKSKLKDASKLWGKDTIETEEAIRAAEGNKKIRVAAIGESGERCSLISGIVNDRGRIAARSGLGAVMGSKRLKAVALAGTGKIEVAGRAEIKDLNKKYLAYIKRTERLQRYLSGSVANWTGRILRVSYFHMRQPWFLWRELLRKFGTGGITSMSSESGDTPVKNWGGAGFRDFPLGSHAGRLGGDQVLMRQKKRYACQSCPVGCGGIVDYDDGRYKVADGHKPEYETVAAFGTLCLNNDLGSIFHLNEVCNLAGIDTISAGVSAAFAIECFENGLLTSKDTDGLQLTWGNSKAIVELVEKMIRREGIGDLLADGVRVAAEKIGKGSERFAIHAGGQEAPMHDSRYDPGFGLAYEAEPTPGRHTIASNTYIELMALEKKYPEMKAAATLIPKSKKYAVSGKAREQAIQSNFVQASNSLGMCIFGLQIGPGIPLFEWTNAATGWDFTDHEYLETGERIQTLRHAYNVREGVKPTDTALAERATGRPPLTYGPNKNITLDQETMVREFYAYYDWDYETGRPSKTRLERLGLKEVEKELHKP